MKKSINPAWLPVGVYLGLAALVAVATALVFHFGPIKQDLQVGDAFDRATAVIVDPSTGKVVASKDLELCGTVTTSRYKTGKGKFSGSLTLHPSFGLLALYESELDVPFPSHSSADASSPSGGQPSFYLGSDNASFCLGPVFLRNWYGLDAGRSYIIAPVPGGVSAKAVLENIPDAPDLSALLDASPVAPLKLRPAPEGIELTVMNCGEDTYNFGSYYLLEKHSYDPLDWIPLDYVTDEPVAWTTQAIPVEPGETETFSIDWEWLYGALPSGQYRIMKNYSPTSNPETALTLSAEFLIH